jgi:uncharacterized membrane protein
LDLFAQLTLLDGAAIVAFAAAFFGYTPVIRLIGARRTLTGNFRAVRRRWMTNVLGKEVRIADAQMIGHIMSSAAFFASTDVLLIAAVFGVLGSVESAHAAFARLSFVPDTGLELFEVKLLVMLFVLIAGFFRFSHAMRQFNYVVALIGSAPVDPLPRNEAERRAVPIAKVMDNAIADFNGGVRSYYFGFAVVAWLAGSAAFLVATLVVFAMLLHRQTRSPTAQAVFRFLAKEDPPHG